VRRCEDVAMGFSLGNRDLNGAGLELLLLQQVSLITAQVLRAQFLRRAVEVFSGAVDG